METLTNNFDSGIGVDAPSVSYGVDDESVPASYKVVIENRSRRWVNTNSMGLPTSSGAEERVVTITGYMQEAFEMATRSLWIDLPTTALRKWSDVTSVAGFSFMGKFSSRRMWANTNPLKFNLNLVFHAETNTTKEVTQPVKELLKLTLPIKPPGGGGYAAILAPGPNPFVEGLNYAETNLNLGEVDAFTEITSLSIGNLWYFGNVIVTDVSVKYLPKYDANGSSTHAIVNIVFETFEIPTRSDIDVALTAKG